MGPIPTKNAKKSEKSARFGLAHLNTSALKPPWRQRQGRFGLQNGPESAKTHPKIRANTSADLYVLRFSRKGFRPAADLYPADEAKGCRWAERRRMPGKWANVNLGNLAKKANEFPSLRRETFFENLPSLSDKSAITPYITRSCAFSGPQRRFSRRNPHRSIRIAERGRGKR